MYTNTKIYNTLQRKKNDIYINKCTRKKYVVCKTTVVIHHSFLTTLLYDLTINVYYKNIC